MDPLYDPDDEDLLDPRQARELAGRVEVAQLASGSIRYGRVGKVGAASVVLNTQNPLPAGNYACGLWGSLGEVARTLGWLEQTFADVGRAEAILYASPTTVDEIEGLADDFGWRAVQEDVVLLHRRDQQRVRPRGAGEPRAVEDSDLAGIAALFADDVDLPASGQTRLTRHIGHRSDDARCAILVSDDLDNAERLAGFAMGFVEHGVALVDHVVVRAGRRRRGVGRALVTALVEQLRASGARLVAWQVEEGGGGQRFAEAVGFDVVYPVTAYARRVEELFD